MTELPRGANASLSAHRIVLAVSGARPGAVDLLVFQLTDAGRVRNDADFVFFNQRESPERAVRLVGGDRVEVDLDDVPPGIETLAVAVALDDSVAGSLAAITGLAVSVGTEHSAAATGLTSERAAVLVEIYRRAGAWKVRNVSAGWSAGLSAMAGEYGVEVDAPAPVPAVPAAPSIGSQTPVRPPVSAGPSPAPALAAPPRPAPVPAAAASGSPAAPFTGPGGYPPPGGTLPNRPIPTPFQPGGWPPPGG